MKYLLKTVTSYLYFVKFQEEEEEDDGETETEYETTANLLNSSSGISSSVDGGGGVSTAVGSPFLPMWARQAVLPI